MSQMACQRVRSAILLVHGPEAPTADEWDEYLKLVDASRALVTQVIVHTEGGGPNPKQRDAVQTLYNTYKPSAPPVAVLSNSVIARGIVTAISWRYGRDKIRAFSPTELDAALAWLRLDRLTLDEVQRVLPALKIRVGAAPPSSARPGPASGTYPRRDDPDLVDTMRVHAPRDQARRAS